MKSCVGINPCDLVSDLVYSFKVSFCDDFALATHYMD